MPKIAGTGHSTLLADYQAYAGNSLSTTPLLVAQVTHVIYSSSGTRRPSANFVASTYRVGSRLVVISRRRTSVRDVLLLTVSFV